MEQNKTLCDLEQENQRLKEENERLKEYRKSLPVKERLYDHINVSVRTLDIFIGCMIVLFVVVIAAGFMNR